MHQLFVDGACRGNPGPASIGASLLLDGKEIGTISKAIGEATNNVAEYQAMIAGMQLAIENGTKRLSVNADSQLMICQMLGKYKVKHPNLKPLFQEAKRLQEQFDEIHFTHVPREENQRADELANLALDA